jgi:hypothetical protein
MLPKNKTMQAGAANKGRQEKRDRLGRCGMEDSSLEDRERAEPEGERETQVRAAQTQTETSTRKRKKRKRQGTKRGEGGREPERRGRKTEAEEKREGGKRKRAGRAIEGMRSGRQMAIVTATQKREKEGEEGRERREKGQHRVGQGVCVHQVISEQEEHEGEKRGATGGQEGDK